MPSSSLSTLGCWVNDISRNICIANNSADCKNQSVDFLTAVRPFHSKLLERQYITHYYFLIVVHARTRTAEGQPLMFAESVVHRRSHVIFIHVEKECMQKVQSPISCRVQQ